MYTTPFREVCKKHSQIFISPHWLFPVHRPFTVRKKSATSKGFGSFHTDDVDVLVRQGAEEYTQPCLPFHYEYEEDFARFKARVSSADFAFGSLEARRLFHLDEDWVFLNHGAFGGALKPISKLANKWRDYAERQPLRFYDRVLFPHMVLSHRALAKFIAANPEDIVTVPNVTTGINAVLQSIPLRSGEGVLDFSTGYGAVKTVIKQVCLENNAKHEEIQVTFPLSSDADIVDLVQRKLASGQTRTFRYLVVDHITSNAAVKMPIIELATMCKGYGVNVIVDGAHGLLSCPLDMAEMQKAGVLYYVSNCHKWLSAPKSSGFVWKNPESDHVLRPRVISTGYDNGMLSSFIWQGCNDYASQLSLPYLLDAWNIIGVEKARQFTAAQLQRGVDILEESWKSRPQVPLYPSTMRGGNMALVQLPQHLQLGVAYADKIQHALHFLYNVEVPVKSMMVAPILCFSHGVMMAVRFTKAHVLRLVDEPCDILERSFKFA